MLNKVDLISEAQRALKIEKVISGFKAAFAQTRFKSPMMIPASARVGGGDVVASADITTLSISELAQALMRCVVVYESSNRQSVYCFRGSHAHFVSCRTNSSVPEPF